MTRLEANREIVRIIADAVERYPYFRYNQLMWHLNIEDGFDNFYRESSDLLGQIKERLQKNDDDYIQESMEASIPPKPFN